MCQQPSPCRNADLEVVLATDLTQLGQVPKLQALSISALRLHLLKELEMVVSQQCMPACMCTGRRPETKKSQVVSAISAFREFCFSVCLCCRRPGEDDL